MLVVCLVQQGKQSKSRLLTLSRPWCRTSDSASTPEVGTEFCTNTIVKKISFTGSTRVGKLLMKLSSDTVKRLSLELGGNAPFVVFEDADLDQAVAAAMSSKFRNAGQTCVCADRFLVHASIHDVFCERLVEKVRGLQLGGGIVKGSTMGPLISEKAAETVAQKVKDAIASGAICEVGGKLLPKLGVQFYEPTVLTNVSLESDIWKSETFGPVAAIVKFHQEEEALRLANDSDMGLASYFCTKDLSRAIRFSQRYVNHRSSTVLLPLL
jgi:succinate-semialdehyde dehydrogenase / glutarate-semialdehyde dehydrogenase